MNRPLSALLLLAATLLSPAVLADDQTPFISSESELQYNIMAGELAAQRREPLAAAQFFMKVLQQQPAAELAMRTTALALVGKDEKLALKAARIWATEAPDEAEAGNAVIRLALRNDEVAASRTSAEARIRSHSDGPAEGFRQVALLLSQEPGHKAEAGEIMDQLVAQWPKVPGAHYAKALLALRFGDLAAAEAAARASLELKANNPETLLLLTGVLVKRGDIPAADQAFSRAVKASNDPAEMHAGYARLLLDAEHLPEARAEYIKALDIKPDLLEARYALGLLALEQEDLAAAEAQFKVLLKNEKVQPAAAYYLGRIAETRKNYVEALGWYEQVTEGDLALDAVTRRAAVMGRTGEVDRARALLAQMREQMPSLATRFYLAEGEVLLEAGAGADAIKLYEGALSESPEDPDLLYGRSLVYERQKKYKEAEADLRAILKKHPEDGRAMNALGYMLTVRGQRLSEARALISRALELDPEDAAVIDSMGWVLYRQGKLRESLELLQKAFGKVKDPEIAAHLGEVLWRMGQKERAREIWEAALTRDPEHRVLKETIQRYAP